MKGHHTRLSLKNSFWKYRYNILHSILPNHLRLNLCLLTFNNHPWNTMIASEQHRNIMSTSGTLITQEYNFHLKSRSNVQVVRSATPFLTFKRFLQYPQFTSRWARTLVGESPVTLWRTRHQAWPWKPSIEPQKAIISNLPSKARTPVVSIPPCKVRLSCCRTSMIAYSVVFSRSTLLFSPWLFKSVRTLFHKAFLIYIFSS